MIVKIIVKINSKNDHLAIIDNTIYQSLGKYV